MTFRQNCHTKKSLPQIQHFLQSVSLRKAPFYKAVTDANKEEELTKRVVSTVRRHSKSRRVRGLRARRGSRARTLAIVAPSLIIIKRGRVRGPSLPTTRTSKRPKKRTVRALKIERDLLKGTKIK